MIERLEACVLPVSDLARSQAFYTEILGFEVVDHHPDEFVILRAGDSEIVLLSPASTQREAKFAGAEPGGAAAIHFRVVDPDGYFESISHAATVLERLGDRQYGDRDFTICDPDGYRLVFGRAIHG